MPLSDFKRFLPQRASRKKQPISDTNTTLRLKRIYLTEHNIAVFTQDYLYLWFGVKFVFHSSINPRTPSHKIVAYSAVFSKKRPESSIVVLAETPLFPKKKMVLAFLDEAEIFKIEVFKN